MQNIGRFGAVAAVILLGACGKTKEGDLTLDRPGDIDITAKKDTIHLPSMPNIDVGTKKDTMIILRPVVGMTKDTVIVTKPTMKVKKGGGR